MIVIQLMHDIKKKKLCRNKHKENTPNLLPPSRQRWLRVYVEDPLRLVRLPGQLGHQGAGRPVGNSWENPPL